MSRYKGMNKYKLQGKIKSVPLTYAMWFFLGSHYAYLGKWGLQFLFWFTLGGVGIWALVDLFLIPGKVERYNELIYNALEALDRKRDQS